MVKIIVQIPAYNEEKSIGEVIKKIPRDIDGNSVEVMVIDDASHDATSQVARESGANYVLVHDYNKGVGGAFKTGVEKFFRLGADILVNIDADGQFDPLDIPKLVEPLLSHKAEIVLASRFGDHKPTNMPLMKYRLNQMIAWAVSKLLKHKVDDLTCGFRAYTREALLRLSLIESFTYTQEVIIDAIGKKIRLLWIPVHVRYFAERKSRITNKLLQYIWRSFNIIGKTIRDTKPAVFFGFPGLLSVGLGFLSLSTFLILYLGSFTTTPYRTFFSVGAFLMCLGLLLIMFSGIADMMRNQRKMTESNMYMIRKMFYDKK